MGDILAANNEEPNGFLSELLIDDDALDGVTQDEIVELIERQQRPDQDLPVPKHTLHATLEEVDQARAHRMLKEDRIHRTRRRTVVFFQLRRRRSPPKEPETSTSNNETWAKSREFP